jgi:hypothetical protein
VANATLWLFKDHQNWVFNLSERNRKLNVISMNCSDINQRSSRTKYTWRQATHEMPVEECLPIFAIWIIIYCYTVINYRYSPRDPSFFGIFCPYCVAMVGSSRWISSIPSSNTRPLVLPSGERKVP